MRASPARLGQLGPLDWRGGMEARGRQEFQGPQGPPARKVRMAARACEEPMERLARRESTVRQAPRAVPVSPDQRVKKVAMAARAAMATQWARAQP